MFRSAILVLMVHDIESNILWLIRALNSSTSSSDVHDMEGFNKLVSLDVVLGT
jgi:hypothetical protein